MRNEVPVVIVGAGASGLAAAACLEKRGVRGAVFEADERVGARWARRYDRLRLHTVRRFSGLPHHRIPSNYPRYVPKDLYARYLEDYVRALELDVRLEQRVTRISPTGDSARPRWMVSTADGDWAARAVVVATGRHNAKRLPDWPGADDFAGEFLHSDDYASGREFAGLRVLVIGIGNSGAEIAAELVEEGAARVALAVRTVPPITPREIMGIPVQLFGIVLMPFPPGLVDRVGAVTRRIGTGDLGKHGLGAAAWGPFTARRPPVIDVGFLRQLKAGRIEVRGDVERLTRDGAVFADGHAEPFDVVVAATGFTTGLEQLVDAPDALDARGYPRSDQPGRNPGLFFIGYDESPRGQLYEANRQARTLASRIARYLREESPAGPAAQ
jgi:putative flavoprotein involved in K+ transport